LLKQTLQHFFARQRSLACGHALLVEFVNSGTTEQVATFRGGESADPFEELSRVTGSTGKIGELFVKRGLP
jgi:hypothetical protein